MNKVQTEDSICLYSLAFEAQQLESVHIQFSIQHCIFHTQIAKIITHCDGERRTLIPYYTESSIKEIV